MSDSFGNPKLNIGQQLAANSAPVVLASDQTLPLPTGAATSANQATANTSLASIDAGIPNALGAAVTAASMPVNIASDQIVPVSQSGTWTTARPASYTTGTISALSGTVTLTLLEGQSSWDVYISGTFSAGSTIQFQGSLDNTNWFNLNGRRSGDATTNDTTTTLSTDVFGGPGPAGGSPSNWRGNISGIRFFRVIATAFQASDAISVQIATSTSTGAVFFNAAIPSGNNVIGQVYSTSASGNVAAVNGFNRLQVSIEPSDLLSDKFDTLDTAIRWTLLSAGGASSPVGGGNLNMTGGTASGSYTVLASQPTFTQKANVQLSHGVTLKFEAGPIVTGAHRFWGFGTAGSNTVANPLTDAVGWEINTTGVLSAVVYGGGTKLYSQALTAPTDGKYHRYSLTWRTDKITFFMDSGDIPSAVANGFIPNTQILPARFHVLSGTVSAAPTLQVAALGVSDTGRNSTAISDGVHGFRKATVNSDGSFNVSGSVASGTADSGNPVKIGGVYHSTLPSVADGSRVDLQLDANGRLLTSTSVTSSLPAASFTATGAINSGSTVYTTYTAAQKLALKQFYAGGTGIAKQVLYSYAPSASIFVNAGDFEGATDVGTTWTWASVGGTGSIAQSTAQAFTGTKSVALTFSNSSNNNAQSVKQVFATSVDYSSYRYISAQFYNVLSTGGGYTRSISIVLTDTAANTRSYTVSGSSTVAPFLNSGWIQILGEIANPSSITGTLFDITAVASITLTMNDSGNKSGTVYWDTVKLSSMLMPLFPIYHQANTSFNINIDPVFIMNIGDQILIAQTNNDSARKEYFAITSGVSIT